MSTKRKQATATPPANPGHAAAAKQRATAKQQHGIHPPAAPKAIAAPVKPPAAPVRPPPDSDEEDLEAIFGKKKSVAGPVAPASKKRKASLPAADATSNAPADAPGVDDDGADTSSSDDEEILNASDAEEEDLTPANLATLRRIKQKLASGSAAPSPANQKVTVLSAPKQLRDRPDEDDFGFTRGGGAGGGVARTAEGYKVYQIGDLGMGKSKNTPLCPIDCDCCF